MIEIAKCSCNTVELQLTARPLFRAYCHCNTCQQYTGREYSDVSIFRAASVGMSDESSVEFKAYQKPPVVQRGKCINCRGATHEKVSMPLMPDLVIVASDLLPEKLRVEPSMHIFYHRRVNDVADSVRKHSGFMKSQLAFMSKLFGALWRTR
jgi:hypothetical protein